MKLLLGLLAFALSASADPIVVAINLQPWSAPLALQPQVPPAVIVMIYDPTNSVGVWDVKLPWTDKNGAPHESRKECFAGDGPNTICVFDVDAAIPGIPIVTEVRYVESPLWREFITSPHVEKR